MAAAVAAATAAATRGLHGDGQAAAAGSAASACRRAAASMPRRLAALCPPCRFEGCGHVATHSGIPGALLLHLLGQALDPPAHLQLHCAEGPGAFHGLALRGVRGVERGAPAAQLLGEARPEVPEMICSGVKFPLHCGGRRFRRADERLKVLHLGLPALRLWPHATEQLHVRLAKRREALPEGAALLASLHRGGRCSAAPRLERCHLDLLVTSIGAPFV
mmetsp:Transcript_19382/g.55195  ORF Transcript_19382/g.55195 Transcript_19382/m.55195 type:complete len:219 (-) Transcript_19382:1091-1747(-)